MRTTTQYKIAGTRSFRLAAVKALDGVGSNLQNFDNNFARLLIADPDHILVQCDQAGAEALIVAHDAPKGLFRSLFEHGIKPHVYMALQIFLKDFIKELELPADALTSLKFATPEHLVQLPYWPKLSAAIKNSAERYATGKRVIHARNYKMGWPTYAEHVCKMSEGETVLSPDVAKFHLDTHTKLFPEISEWQDRVLAEAKTTRVIRNLFGYPRRITKPWSMALEREIVSFRPQSTVGCVTHHAAVRVQDAIEARNLPFDLLNNKHDSLVSQCPDTEERVQQAAELLHRAMTPTLTALDGHQFKMKAEVMVGSNFGKRSPDNPNGLKDYKLDSANLSL